jgi:hypothetical protein
MPITKDIPDYSILSKSIPDDHNPHIPYLAVFPRVFEHIPTQQVCKYLILRSKNTISCEKKTVKTSESRLLIIFLGKLLVIYRSKTPQAGVGWPSIGILLPCVIVLATASKCPVHKGLG